MGILSRLLGSTGGQVAPPVRPSLEDQLFDAVLAGDLERVVKILQQKPDVHARACVVYDAARKRYAGANARETAHYNADPAMVSAWGNVREMTPPELAAALRAADPNRTKVFSAIKRALVTAGFPRLPMDLERELRAAIAADNLQAAEALLQGGADVEGCLCDKESPLHTAARRGLKQMAGLLLDHGARMEERTASQVAQVEREDFSMEDFLDGNPQLIRITLGGYTPLMIAVELGHEELACFLVERGADVNACDGQGETVLMKAARMHLETVVALLRSRGAQGDSAGCQVALTAARYADRQRALLVRGART